MASIEDLALPRSAVVASEVRPHRRPMQLWAQLLVLLVLLTTIRPGLAQANGPALSENLQDLLSQNRADVQGMLVSPTYGYGVGLASAPVAEMGGYTYAGNNNAYVTMGNGFNVQGNQYQYQNVQGYAYPVNAMNAGSGGVFGNFNSNLPTYGTYGYQPGVMNNAQAGNSFGRAASWSLPVQQPALFQQRPNEVFGSSGLGGPNPGTNLVLNFDMGSRMDDAPELKPGFTAVHSYVDPAATLPMPPHDAAPQVSSPQLPAWTRRSTRSVADASQPVRSASIPPAAPMASDATRLRNSFVHSPMLKVADDGLCKPGCEASKGVCVIFQGNPDSGAFCLCRGLYSGPTCGQGVAGVVQPPPEKPVALTGLSSAVANAVAQVSDATQPLHAALPLAAVTWLLFFVVVVACVAQRCFCGEGVARGYLHRIPKTNTQGDNAGIHNNVASGGVAQRLEAATVTASGPDRAAEVWSRAPPRRCAAEHRRPAMVSVPQVVKDESDEDC